MEKTGSSKLNEKRLKVLIVLPGKLPVPAIYGGAIESTLQFILEQNHSKGNLEIVIISKTFNKLPKYNHVKYFFIDYNRLYHWKNFFFRVCRKLGIKIDNLDGEIVKRHVRRSSYDLVVIHGNSYWLKILAKVVNKEKLIFFVHANIFNDTNSESRLLGTLAGNYVAVSNFIKRNIVENGNVIESAVKVLKNPVNVSQFKKKRTIHEKMEVINAANFDANLTTLLFAGRLVRDKGLYEVLQAMKLLKDEGNTVNLLVVGSFGSGFAMQKGSTEYEGIIRRYISKHNLNVFFAGFVKNEVSPKYFHSCDIVLMPSLCDEAAGKVAMEGLASSKPVITTRKGGISEYIPDKAGILLELDSSFVDKLAESIRKLKNQKGLRETMGRYGFNVALNEFSEEIYYERYSALLENIHNRLN